MRAGWLGRSLVLLLTGSALAQSATGVPPSRMLWSWFADDDLRFLKPRQAGVAYRALSLTFRGATDVIPHPRKSRLLTPPGLYEMGVVRFDLAGAPAFSDRQRHVAVKMMIELVKLTHMRALQIDFDAPRSSFPFYRQLLADLRRGLGNGIFLSITALVDWCDRSQSWLTGLPVDELVPMAFAMGPYTQIVDARLRAGNEFPFSGCRNSIGLDRTGPLFKVAPAKRIYFFSSQAWSPIAVRAAFQAVTE